MKNINRVTLIGQLTADPQRTVTTNGTTLTSFRVATNYSWKNSEGEWQEGVDFHRVVAWGALAERVATLYKKGEPIYVEGKLRTRTWVDDEGGKHSMTEVVAKNLLPMTSVAAKKRAQELGEDEVGSEEEAGDGVTILHQDSMAVPV